MASILNPQEQGVLVPAVTTQAVERPTPIGSTKIGAIIQMTLPNTVLVRHMAITNQLTARTSLRPTLLLTLAPTAERTVTVVVTKSAITHLEAPCQQ